MAQVARVLAQRTGNVEPERSADVGKRDDDEEEDEKVLGVVA